ncbi:MAG: uroporphyrinogen decarboxylase family protein, partial [Candidatus Marinimicrobia bacterium]|nr:uroporphyrinogen decarboxylase family protein [Candidatus Neomarinimicrobiota bacterium]
MGNTSREIVKDTLLFNNPSRVPCEIFYSNWAKNKYPQIINKIQNRFPNDIIVVDNQYKKSSKVKGNKNRIGKYIDEWSCEFVNIKDGMIGEVKKPLLKNLSEWKKINPPYELLPDNSNKFNNLVNNFCKNSNKFVRAKCIPRPWERYQLIRGTENALMDCVSEDENFFHLLNLIHKYYIKEFEIWARTAVDGMMFMDDWGSQNQMMISPKLWRTIFKPLYREYCEIAHSHGKFVFMHSDGYIMDIFEDLIEIGVDAINSQLFCMDIE